MTYEEALAHVDEQIASLEGCEDSGSLMAKHWLEISKNPEILTPDELIKNVEEWLAEEAAKEEVMQVAVLICGPEEP